MTSRQTFYSSDMQSQDEGPTNTVNVSLPERALSLASGVSLIAGGAALVLIGMQRLGKVGLAGIPLALIGGGLLLRGVTGHSVAYRAANVNTAVMDESRKVSVPHQQGIHVVKVVTIMRPADELYRFWRNFENLPRIMKHLEAVHVIDDRLSHWVAKAPAGTRVEWDAEIVNEIENEVIGWRSLENAQIANAGSVRFSPAPGGRGTVVRVTLEYVPPAGKLGVAIARLLGEEPDAQIGEDLHRFKQLTETGEIPTDEIKPSEKSAMLRQDDAERASGQGRYRSHDKAKDVVQAASEQSFPASDPPGWTFRDAEE